MNLTKNFTLEELTYSDYARRFGIPNDPTPEAVDNLRHLCEHLLQPVRDTMGMPLRISSGYRSPLLNLRIGGARNSQHCTGQAADIVVPRQHINALYHLIEDNYVFDQLIYETRHDKNGHVSSCWIHVSLKKEGNRMQAFAIDE